MAELYSAIHERMTERELATGDKRPTASELVEALGRFSIQPAGVALDAGCGGTLSLSIACAEHGFTRVEAVDLNERSLHHACGVIARTGHSAIDLCRASVTSLPFPNAAFDFAICSGVAHHTPEPEAVIQELHRVLKTGGVLYISLYSFAGSLSELMVRGLRRLGTLVRFKRLHQLVGSNQTINNFVLDHMYVPILWIFRAEEVREMLGRHGFAITQEWASKMDPLVRYGRLGRLMSGDGLIRVWLCRKT